MGKFLAWVGGVGAGAAAAWWLDPQNGRRRRALVQDKVTHVAKQARNSAQVVARDASHRVQGMKHSVTGYLHADQAPDDILVMRVRSRLGHVCSHPGAIHVTCQNGHLTLYGAVLEAEADRVLSECQRIKGVHGVDNRMDLHPDAGGIPALQGGSRAGELRSWAERPQTPAARAGTAGLGALLCLGGLARGGILGWTGVILGAGLVARGAGNVDLEKVRRLARRGQALSIHRSIVINAPVDTCFNLWSDLEQLPACLSHIKEVRNLGDGRYHWVVGGPGALSLEWDAVLTQTIPNRVLAWKSVEDAVIPNAGILTFTPTEDGGTYVDVQLHYTPPRGPLAQDISHILGADPHAQVQQDLERFKLRAERAGSGVTAPSVGTPYSPPAGPGRGTPYPGTSKA